MTPAMIVIRKVSTQARPSFGWRWVIADIHILVLHRAPQTFNHDIVECPAYAVHADRDTMVRQDVRERLRCKLTALVGVKDRGSSIPRPRKPRKCQRTLERLDTKDSIKRVR